ncbi:unnamed protein product [Acanthoscelides obtectus]|uniref:Uncharacterized protein n=1 Tax=Acanthoscelides obtectus TaxID=200917 RepID=A0A9P0K3T6_ACAOB|nr:unnamed protein product [Acanthoscelides obtectus]CAK1669951.1 hypothetical protein AOBTE_LOCUS27319 [Acanthoscelides obtectus]
MAHRLVETSNHQDLFHAFVGRHNESISISIDCFVFVEEKWPNDGFGANAGPISHFPVMQRHFVDLMWIFLPSNAAILLINTAREREMGLIVITICLKKSGSASTMRAIVWTYSKRRGWSVGNIFCVNCTFLIRK